MSADREVTKIKANLEWINHEWRNWLESSVGKRVVGTRRVKEHPEHIAKLFAAFCLDQLHAETEATNNF